MIDDSASRSPTEVRRPKESSLQVGLILANRYEIRRPLGRGGMGEVWLAYDLRLRVEVALKALHRADPAKPEMLHREIRAAREVISPNVCRIFDLVEADGLELLSMEFVDGVTLCTFLEEHSPLNLYEAQEIAAQFLAGLDAIHAAGLVHRDFKPENVMITRTGRVAVMDLGLAKPAALEPGSVAGTRPYMAPEQLHGRVVDRRADVFSAGVVLAEMVHPAGVRDADSRESVWTAAREQPPRLPETPWSAILRRSLTNDPNERYDSASALSRALEEVTRRLGLADETSPYPGLASFAETQAKNFFGREAEVEAMWRKLSGPARLLGLIGPSGAGKSSLLRAGLIPAKPEGWAILITTPGSRPFAALARALAPHVAGDVEAIADLTQFDDPAVAIRLLSTWRRRQDQALLIMDQFEELFTLTPVETQQRFSELLSRLAIDADIHVLLSMRDDFLIRCHDYDTLAPLFSELTPLKAPAGDALWRALVQPALKHGYQFEDERLVEEILEQVSDERGALPLAAFAMAKLWEKREREKGLLTHAAYEEIGGVAGALAQHAEATLERIGAERGGMVRELFGNLVTAQGTRAARDREELLSLFPNRQEANEVINALIAARLLTSYETSDEQPRIEIIHESLLTAWPRLVRWQTQDAEGAQLRDELRQAAYLWEQHGRAEDYLWTGTAFREYQLWRERYPGALSSAEEPFARAMVSSAERRKRRTRLAFASALVAAIVVAGILAVSWRRSAVSEQRARAETGRAEAQKLLALSQVELERYPTAALAYATKSLELADNPDVRQRIMEILWRGPIARILPVLKGTPTGVIFSPDGNWLAVLSRFGSDILVPAGGGPQRKIGNPAAFGGWMASFSNDARFLAIQGVDDQAVRVFSVPDMKVVRAIPNDQGRFVADNSVITMSPDKRKNVLIRSWPFAAGDPVNLGLSDQIYRNGDIHPRGSSIVFPRGQAIYVQAVGDPMQSPRVLWNVGDNVVRTRFYEGGETVGARTQNGMSLRFRDGRVRSIEASSLGAEVITLPHDLKKSKVVFATSERQVYGFRLWDLDAPPSSVPLKLRWPPDNAFISAALHPAGDWVATSWFQEAALWPLNQPFPRVIPHNVGANASRRLQFTPDSKHLLSCGNLGGFQRWSLNPPEESALITNVPCIAQAIDRRGRNVVAGDGDVFLISLAGDPTRKLLDVGVTPALFSAAFDPTGEIVAVHFKDPNDAEKTRIQIEVIHVGSGRVNSLSVESPSVHGREHRSLIGDLDFAFDGMLYSAGVDGIRRWNVATGESQMFRKANTAKMVISGNGRYMLAALGRPVGQRHTVTGDLVLFDLQQEAERRITTHGSEFNDLAIDEKGEIIGTVDTKGTVRIGKASGGEPHLLVMDSAEMYGLAISPDRKWVVTTPTGTIRLWPMPDLSKPPLHTLPHDELMAKLRELTNLRAVADRSSATGYKLEIGPFPGWQKVPTW